jgi:hypothetical protein
MHCTLTLELTETIEAEVTVWFNCTYRGDNGDYYNPPEPPEFEIVEVELEVLFGATWEKTGREVAEAGWAAWTVDRLGAAIDAYDELYDHQIDAYNCEER